MGTQPATPAELQMHMELQRARDEISALKEERETAYRKMKAQIWQEARPVLILIWEYFKYTYV